MAELALGVVGVALAWKGVVDFCDLLGDLIRDEEEQRRGLSLRARCVKKSFEDWGIKYGIEDSVGAFAAFDSERKEIIAEVLQRQLTASSKVFKVLQRYDNTIATTSGSALAFKQAVSSYRKALRKSTHKIKWKLADERLVVETVEDLERQSSNLWDLTCNVKPEICRDSKLDTEQILAIIKTEIQSLRDLMNSREGRDSLSQNTCQAELAIHASLRSIAPFELLERVEGFAQRAFWTGIDSRIGEELAQWWTYATVPFICVETRADLEDETPALTSAAFYTTIRQPKFVYISDPLQMSPNDNTLAKMYNSLTQQAVQYILSTGKPVELPPSCGYTQPDFDYKMDVIASPEVLRALMLQIINSQRDLVFVIEGMESLVMANPQALQMCRLFIQTLREVNQEAKAECHHIRALFIGPGRGCLFSSADNDVQFFDAMNGSGVLSNLFEQLHPM